MREIRLQTLKLHNFKGMTFTLEANGNDCRIYGRNASGKTTLWDAFSWLLFEKDSTGKSDFEIKNLNPDGSYEHGLEHSVEAVLTVSGETLTLKKTYKEIWTKKRGAPQAIFSGHTVDYEIDGVPVQKKLYTEKIKEIAGDEEIFRVLTSPIAFPALHWQKQRKILMDICSNITDEEVIASDPQLAELPRILAGKSVDDCRKAIARRKQEINAGLEHIPIKIGEVRRGIPDLTGLDFAELQAKLSSLEFVNNEKKLKLQGIETGGEIGRLASELSYLMIEIKKIESEMHEDRSKKNGMIAEHNFRIKTIDEIINLKQKVIEAPDLKRLQEKYKAIEEETFQAQTICPTCKQNIPESQIQEALARFNAQKAERLKMLSSEEDEIKAKIKDAQEEIEALLKEKEMLTEQIKALAITKCPDIYYQALSKKEQLQKQIAEAKSKIDVSNLKAEIAETEKEISDIREKINRFALAEAGEKRIAELMRAEKTMSEAYELLEKELHILDLFTRRKVSMLTEKINEQFEMVRFKLFNILVNGGLEECCELTVNGVPYNGGLNHSAQIQGGCDVIRTLQRHYGLRAPLFIDNRESVTVLPEMDCQLISLIVSEHDPGLRVEINF